MREQDGSHLSRFAVMSAAVEAWAVDGKSRLYRYDGVRFWRRRKQGARSVIVPSWQAPVFGWAHLHGCGCDLCVPSPDATREAA